MRFRCSCWSASAGQHNSLRTDPSTQKETGSFAGAGSLQRTAKLPVKPGVIPCLRGRGLRTAVVFNVGLGRFAGVVRSMGEMTVSKVSMMCRSLVPSSLMMLGGFAMMSSRMFVVFRCLVMMFHRSF